MESEDWFHSMSDEAQAFWTIMVLLVGVPALVGGVAIAVNMWVH